MSGLSDNDDGRKEKQAATGLLNSQINLNKANTSSEELANVPLLQQLGDEATECFSSQPQQQVRLPVLDERKPLFFENTSNTFLELGLTNTDGVLESDSELKIVPPCTTDGVGTGQNSLTITSSDAATTQTTGGLGGGPIRRPLPVSNYHGRMMSVDHTSLDLDAIDSAAASMESSFTSRNGGGKHYRKDSEFEPIMTNSNLYYNNNANKMSSLLLSNHYSHTTPHNTISNSANNESHNLTSRSNTASLLNLYVQNTETGTIDVSATTTDLEAKLVSQPDQVPSDEDASSTKKEVASGTSSQQCNTEMELDQSSKATSVCSGSEQDTVSSTPAATTTETINVTLPNSKSDEKNKIKSVKCADNSGAHHIPAAKAPLTPRERSHRVCVGICAMDKKAKSKPMAEILSRLDSNLFYVVFFGDHVILNEPIQQWPICEVLIAFFSKGYPLEKAKEYVKLRKPLLLNDLDCQVWIQDRRKVYDHLELSGIDVPRHVYLSRDGYISKGSGDGNGSRDQEVLEFDDHIEINGVSIHKPFVEKPVDAEDHNISIYYPTSAGGGCKKLFRKIGNRSSEFYSNVNEVRRDGSYIYEEFVETQGTDVKMYSVGPEYGHAEARKSPAVDGKVERDQDGKEVRFPVILTFREKEIARRIVLVFKQFVCGFDILRVQEGHSVVSYVCDVNGWSFVKNSRKYYDDCAQILSEHIICAVKPAAHKTFSTLDPLVTTSLNRESGSSLALAIRMNQSCDAANNKIMMQKRNRSDQLHFSHTNSVSDTAMSDEGSTASNEMSLKSEAATLVEGALPVREFPDNLTSEPAPISKSSNESSGDNDSNNNNRTQNDNSWNNKYNYFGQNRSDSFAGTHEEELRCVIAIVRHGDRTPKQKLKINLSEPHVLRYFHEHSKDCKKELKVKSKAPLTEFLEIVKLTISELPKEPVTADSLRYQLFHMRDILERWKIVGLNRKIQVKPRKFEEYVDESDGSTRERCTEVQLVLKWGGNLTKLGERQSIQLGRRFRHAMYPDAPGGGILRLHSTFRHDLKIKTSDEGRVMKTAAAFAKGLLELEGDLPPILVSLVHKEKGSMHMLDPSGNKEVKMELDECKEKITNNLQRDINVCDASEEDLEHLVGPKEITSIRRALAEVGNPRQALLKIHKIMGELIGQLDEMLVGLSHGEDNSKDCDHGEGIRAESEADVALSGVKLYKGETLLELTERWRFIYNRLYDEASDTFDLSRIPDVHDNVRFDMLHNPHIGLTKTLQALYEVGKAVADCVVPQEYGTTIVEKRSVGVKICHGLLEKVKYDLSVARTDNEVDMRYMINMAYAADLPINTMGRRIRTRLYFTSESHLHTVLNVLRFGYCDGDTSHLAPLLSPEGLEILNETPELCYLTHLVFRVFEDSRSEMADNPQRFRVEILFSPGAHHTPLHMNELDRDHDASRFDTAPLQVIGRDCLTCEEVEEFFEKAIAEGQQDGTSTSPMSRTVTT